MTHFLTKMDVTSGFFIYFSRHIFNLHSGLALATCLSRQAVTDTAAGCAEWRLNLCRKMSKKKWVDRKSICHVLFSLENGYFIAIKYTDKGVIPDSSFYTLSFFKCEKKSLVTPLSALEFTILIVNVSQHQSLK